VGCSNWGREVRRAPVLLVAVPSHRRSLLMNSMHKRILILCKAPGAVSGQRSAVSGQRSVVSDQRNTALPVPPGGVVSNCGDKGDGRLRFEVAQSFKRGFTKGLQEFTHTLQGFTKFLTMRKQTRI
jgi:hypothetical protein